MLTSQQQELTEPQDTASTIPYQVLASQQQVLTEQQTVAQQSNATASTTPHQLIASKQQVLTEQQTVAQQRLQTADPVPMPMAGLSLAQMLDLLDDPEELISPDGPESRPTWPGPVLGQNVGPTPPEKVSQWIILTGGVTFAAINVKYVLAFFVFYYEVEWAVFTVLKLECLLSMLVWYWISYDEHIRLTTDAMFLTVIKRICSCWIWPARMRSWAQQLEIE